MSSGGLALVEALPGSYQAYASWLPLRYIVDGLRALLFYDGRSASGLGEALRVLGAYLTGSAIVVYLISLLQAFVIRRKGPEAGGTYQATPGAAR